MNEKVPRDLETICLKAMSKAPSSRRYATARELADDLRSYLGGKPIRARPVGLAVRLWHWCRRNPVAASLLLAVTLGSAFGLWHLTLLSGLPRPFDGPRRVRPSRGRRCSTTWSMNSTARRSSIA